MRVVISVVVVPPRRLLSFSSCVLLFTLVVFWSAKIAFTHPNALYEFTHAQADVGVAAGDYHLSGLVNSVFDLRDQLGQFSTLYKPMVAITLLMLVLRLFTFLGTHRPFQPT